MSQRSTRLREGEQRLIWRRLADVECALSVICANDVGIQRKQDGSSQSQWNIK